MSANMQMVYKECTMKYCPLNTVIELIQVSPQVPFLVV